jgi:hypothetical protein
MLKGSPSVALSRHAVWASARLVFAAIALSVVLGTGSVACASRVPPTALAATRDVLAGLDDFGALLLGAGLYPDAIPTEREVSPLEARRLRTHLAILPSVPQHYAPRTVADRLLRGVEDDGKPVTRYELSLRVQHYRDRFMIQPDGYIAAALTGRPVMCVGPVEVGDSGASAGGFHMGFFYVNDNGGYSVTDDPAIGEL